MTPGNPSSTITFRSTSFPSATLGLGSPQSFYKKLEQLEQVEYTRNLEGHCHLLRLDNYVVMKTIPYSYLESFVAPTVFRINRSEVE